MTKRVSSGRILSTVLLSAVMLLAASTAAQAAPEQNTVGWLLENINRSMIKAPNFISFVGYIGGLLLVVTGILKFKDHVDNPMQHPISGGIKRLLAGGMMFSLPMLSMALRGSLFRNETINPEMTGFTNNVQLSDGGLDEMVVHFIGNIIGPAIGLLTAFTYIAGFALLLVGIKRLTKRMEEGPRGPAGAGTIMTFIASGALFSFANSAGVFVTSIFGDNQLMTKVVIGADVISDQTDRFRIQKVIEGLMLFVMLVGYIAFVRGWFVLKAFADGQSGATVAQGLTFLLGGALAINLGELVNALQNTVGVSGLSFG